MVYEASSTLYAVIASISTSDVVTYGTPVSVGSAVTPTAKVSLIGTDKVVIVYSASASVNAVSIIATVSGTGISL